MQWHEFIGRRKLGIIMRLMFQNYKNIDEVSQKQLAVYLQLINCLFGKIQTINTL